MSRPKIKLVEPGRPSRPAPPATILESLSGIFVPAPELVDWMVETFIAEEAPLANEDHQHLRYASIGGLWTNVENVTKQRRIAGTAEKPLPPPGAGKWARARWYHQMEGWFGEIPDFLLTFDANLADIADDASWCAWCEHELYHCGQQLNEFGGPKFRRNGLPAYAIRGHDAEEFVGVVRRYGVGAAAGGVSELVAAAGRRPEIAQAKIGAVCGTCLRMVA